MTIRHTKMLREFKPTLKPKEDNAIFIACFVVDTFGRAFDKGVWHYRKYHFSPNKRTKMVKINSSFWQQTLPMTSLQKYGIEQVIKYEYKHRSNTNVPLSIIREMHLQLQNSNLNWLEIEKPWINKFMMSSMKDYYTGNSFT